MDTLKSNVEISRLFSAGRRFKSPFVTVIVAKHPDSSCPADSEQHDRPGRVAFIAGKKLGNAGWRNRAKRRLRALCKDLSGPWDNYDVILMARAGLTDADYHKVLQTLEHALKRALS